MRTTEAKNYFMHRRQATKTNGKSRQACGFTVPNSIADQFHPDQLFECLLVKGKIVYRPVDDPGSS